MIPPEQLEPWDDPEHDTWGETLVSLVLLVALVGAFGVGAWQVVSWAFS